MTAIIRCVIGRACVTIDVESCHTTLLDWWRNSKKLTGTKEGCAEGDCGACTLVLGEVVNGRVRYRPVNSCIMLVPMIEGKHLLSVEHLAESESHPKPHRVQSVFADYHASQCGFCTPGFIMSLYCALLNGESPERDNIDDIFSGNLCRCTGYGPIIAAAQAVLADNNFQDNWQSQQQQLLDWEAEKSSLVVTANNSLDNKTTTFLAPRTLTELHSAKAQSTDALVIAGGTDVGLWITKALREFDSYISTARVAELQAIKQTESGLEIGAAVSYQDAAEALTKLTPAFSHLLRRIASRQIRSSGTIGGNIANGSPIGDMPPVLIALASRLVLSSQAGTREVAIEDFFIDYGKQDLAANEIVEKLIIPAPRDNVILAFHKISKRFDQDISAVLGAFAIVLDSGVVTSARIAYGGMAATPKRAQHVEQALRGKPWNEETVNAACSCFAQDFQPLSDMRACAQYRMQSAQNLLRRVYYSSVATDAELSIEQQEPSYAAH